VYSEISRPPGSTRVSKVARGNTAVEPMDGFLLGKTAGGSAFIANVN
jgi:hypothetical protein